jgi:hypothetical protein
VILMCLLIGIRAAADIVAIRRVVSMDSLAWSTVLVAGLSYRFLETPFLRLKEGFSQLRSAKSRLPYGELLRPTDLTTSRIDSITRSGSSSWIQ